MDAGLVLSESLIQRVRARATGADVHAVNNVIGAYRLAVGLAAMEPGEPKWAEIAGRNARMLQAYSRTGRMSLGTGGVP